VSPALLPFGRDHDHLRFDEPDVTQVLGGVNRFRVEVINREKTRTALAPVSLPQLRAAAIVMEVFDTDRLCFERHGAILPTDDCSGSAVRLTWARGSLADAGLVQGMCAGRALPPGSTGPTPPRKGRRVDTFPDV
jgi:hypothetical protein